MSNGISKNVLLIFSQEVMYKPIIYKLAANYQIAFNILEAKIYPRQEGRIILQLTGSEQDIAEAIAYMRKKKVQVEILAEKIKRDLDKCTHCGACTAVCRTDALSLDKETREVTFCAEKCVACGLCELACPVKAMSLASIDMDMELAV